jgi:hypothetical protein
LPGIDSTASNVPDRDGDVENSKEQAMTPKTITLIGSAALAAGPALASPPAQPAQPVPVAASYSELLQPIPNAVERLRLADAQAGARPAVLVEAQYHHHHHHHHNHNRWWYEHHGYYWHNGAWVLRPRHHHHHHHHNNY